MRRRMPLSGDLADRARAFAAGAVPVGAVKDAATVVLLRDSEASVEVYLLHRVTTMAFAAGAYVFPGGGVDARDEDAEIQWAGPSRHAWAAKLAAPPALAGALVCAAVRETFEEAGVLLAGRDTGGVVPDTSGDAWERDRAALADHRAALAALLHGRGLVLRSDLVHAWSRWITPEFEPRRYDTRFFVAALPDGQRARDVSGEADEVLWARPRDVLAAAERGEMTLMPPTRVTLTELTGYDTVAAVLDAAGGRAIEAQLPWVDVHPEGVELVLPEDADD